MGIRGLITSLGVAAIGSIAWALPASAEIVFEKQWGQDALLAPGAVDTDSEGNVYVNSVGSVRIYKFDPEGEELDDWGGPGAVDGTFDILSGISVNRADNVLYALDRRLDATGSRVQKFQLDGNFIQKWGSEGIGDGEFSGPRGIAVDPAGGNVYVADRENHRVQIFNEIGQFVGQFGEFGYEDGAFFDKPMAIAIGPTGEVYVGDLAGSIRVFSSDGGFIRRFAGQETSTGEDGKFGASRGVTVLDVDSRGYVYAVDEDNLRVQVFSPAGDFVEKWGSEGAGEGQFLFPRGMTAENGTIYVTDSDVLGQNARVQKFTDTTFNDPPVDDPDDPNNPDPEAANSFKVIKQKANRRKGHTALSVRVPGAGRLQALGSKRNRPASRRTGRAGVVKLTLKTKGKATRQLRQRKRLVLKVKLRFTPEGGDPRTKVQKVRFFRN